ncbi:MAG: hypothetical protein ACREP7_04345 [Lysobacter sp.]
MRNRKWLAALGLSLIGVATAAWAIPPVCVGELHEYYSGGRVVGWAQRDCEGHLIQAGYATEDVDITYLACLR